MGKHTHEVSQQNLHSPNDLLTLTVGINEHRQVWYELRSEEETIITGSRLSLSDNDGNDVLILQSEPKWSETSFDETWEQPWGEQRFVRNHYTELALETSAVTIRFRLYDDGLGFRYELLGEGTMTLRSEDTEFNFNQNAHAWWIPALGQNHYEHHYRRTALRYIDTAHTPLTLELPNGVFAAIHEAALYDYGAMNIIPTEHGLRSSITPLNNGTIGSVTLPFSSPWRTVIVADTAAALLKPKIMLNLNEPSKIKDTSWIQPLKFMGIWWGMFIGTFTWASGPHHGATTTNAFRYINAAAALGIRGLLIEGWNEGWDGDWTQNGALMNHLQPYPDFDIHAITSYAASKGIEIVGHHETSGAITHYESELPEAYDYYRHLGVRYIKTGYVSPRLDNGEFHSSQAGVRHYQKTVEMAADRNLMLDIHEPVKGTGIERTWPNLLTREGVMGQEYEGGAVHPEHTATLPFTRLLAGPLDYTTGLFNLNRTSRHVHTTLGKQLALYVVLYSPMQMAADLPEHYVDQPAFEFVKNVPINWEVSLPLDGVIGDYFAIARKDRESDDWYIGVVTDEEARTLSLSLDFLPDHQRYSATLYRDADDAHWDTNPEALIIEAKEVQSTDTLTLRMAPGGGSAIRLTPVSQTPPPYGVHE
jgi:alpha-glucosidase